MADPQDQFEALLENLTDLTFNFTSATEQLKPKNELVQQREKRRREPLQVLDEKIMCEEINISTPEGSFLQADGQLGFVEEHITDRQYATLQALEVIAGEPFLVRYGERFKVCGKHWLVACSIIEPPQHWTTLLNGTVAFIPWPDILAADFFGPTVTPVVMVQPDLKICGTILSLYRHRYGEESVVKE